LARFFLLWRFVPDCGKTTCSPHLIGTGNESP
jgi:hypothetical protein